MIGIILALLVAILWSLGEVTYSKISKKYDNTNVYMYTYFVRTMIYLSVVLLFKRSLFGTFHMEVFSSTLPIILCDLFASLVINVAVYNGKLSVVSPIMAAYPVLDIILGLILLREKTTPLEIGLVVIISICIIILAMNQKKSKKAPNPLKGIFFSILYMLLVAFSTYFEKSIYISDFTVFELYYYKGMIYFIASLFFALIILMTPQKMKKPNFALIKGCGITPIGNVLYSFALSCTNIMIVTPISSLYSALTSILSRRVLKEKINIREKICIGVIIISTFLLIIIKVW